MRPIDRFKAGDPLSASRFNALRDALAPGGLAIGSGLDLARVGGGSSLRRPRRSPITAVLSGASSPYSWAQEVETGYGVYSAGPLSGSASAYEVNGVAGLAGSRVRLVPDPYGAWRFQSIRSGAGGGPDPETCLCWPVDSTPSSLAWSAAWEAADEPFVGPWTSIGTKSGTLTEMAVVTYPDYTGGDTCLPMELDPDPGSLGAGVTATGWIGPWTDFCFIPGPGDVSTGTVVSRPQCIDGNATCSSAAGTYCRHLWFVCNPIGAFLGNPGGHAGLGYTYAGIPSGPGAGSGAVRCGGDRFPEYEGASSLSCGPFSYTILYNVNSLLRFTLTITE